ncbi:hypothetical protein DV738_g5527, partial [Chaetothyriales sp. CBS 135597]
MSYQPPPGDDNLAYGDDYSQSRGKASQSAQSGDHGLLGSTFNKLKARYDQHQQSSSQNYGYSSGSGQPYSQQPPSTGYPQSAQPGPGYTQPATGYPQSAPQQKQDFASGVFGALHGTIQSIGSDVGRLLGTEYRPPGQQPGTGPAPISPGSTAAYAGPSPGFSQPQQHRYQSFAAVKGGNDVKWYVDGCGYFWAVSKALEEAKESVWILDWWLSPELYLRRPGDQNEEWRLDRVLQRAANRGVKINVIVYKEVTQALSLSSAHTKHFLEALSPNIAVFRHPDHLPDSQTTQSSIISAFQGLQLNAASISKLGQDTLKGIYGITDGVILYWAHHEKLCLIDGKHAFMGGLDICFGRWDTYQHPISDVHPENPNSVTFTGQDYNNARVLDFADVPHPLENKLDRTKTSRMGWSDISVSLHGPCVDDLRHHFIDRWNFIYSEKYNVRRDVRYAPLADPFPHDSTMQVPVPQHLVAAPQEGAPHTPASSTGQYQQGSQQLPPSVGQQSYSQIYAPPPGSRPYTQPAWQTTVKPQTSKPAAPQQSQQQQAPGGSQVQQGGTQQYYPPPPPGPPPQGQSSQTVTPQSQTSFFGTPQLQPVAQTGQSAYASQQQQQAASPAGQSTYVPPQQQQGVHQSGQPQYVPYQGSAELSAAQGAQQPYQQQVSQPQTGARGLDDGSERGFDFGGQGLSSRFKGEKKQFEQELSSLGDLLADGIQQKTGKFLGGKFGSIYNQNYGPMQCQILRSCTLWSNGTPTEKSIQSAYIDVIERSQHFVYIENQFFITATGDKQKPVQNLIGKALVDRILRAARSNQKYKVIVLIPAVPAFAGDLRDDDSLGTRAIMEFQYFSINRGGHSIMELIAQAGYNPLDYIRFYNLRNYDRIRVGNRAGQVQTGQPTQQYSKGAVGRWDSVASCYMLGGEDIRNVPWDGPPESEIDAFVTEQLYIHSKCLIADDRVVIVGSANLNDRSQRGDHDSEIAILIDDPTPVQTTMNGRPWQASRFAASLRRQLFRKHLGLLLPQDMTRPDANFEPVGVPNFYDWGSAEDHLVSDPLADTFQAFWNTRARTNTEAFRKAFRVVPDDTVHTWNDYLEFYGYYFAGAVPQAQGRKPPPGVNPAQIEYGHVIRDNFPGGVKELKDLLSTVKGTLVEMPLTFLAGEYPLNLARGYFDD